MVKRTNYDAVFKAKVVLEAVRGDKTISELSIEYNVASRLVSKWKSELLANTSNAFGVTKQKSLEETEHKLYQQIGKLTMEVDYLKKFVAKYR